MEWSEWEHPRVSKQGQLHVGALSPTLRAKEASVILNKNVGLCVQTSGAKLPEDLLKALGDSLKFKSTANQNNPHPCKGVDLCD